MQREREREREGDRRTDRQTDTHFSTVYVHHPHAYLSQKRRGARGRHLAQQRLLHQVALAKEDELPPGPFEEGEGLLVVLGLGWAG